jgi:flagellar biosynthesis anti-sigma factor FlgM
MDVKKIATYRDPNSAKLQEVELRPTEQTKTPSRKTSLPGEASDRVEFSRGYQELDKLKKVVMEMTDIRTERVDQIRDAIQNGAYEINSDKVAARILEEQW